MDESSQKPENHLAAYRLIVEHRDHAAEMCALYTDAGLYDLAKDNAALWRKLDLDARLELVGVIDEGKERRDRFWRGEPAPQGPQ